MVLLCLAVGFAGTRLGLCWVLLEERWPEYRTLCRRPTRPSHSAPSAIRNKFGWRRSAARTCLVAVEVLISLVLPDFKAILNLVGGSTIAIMSFVMPPLCYLRLSAAKNPVGLPFRNVGVWERVVLWGVVVMGVAQSLVTSYTATSSFMSRAVLQRSFSGVTKAEPPAWSYGSRAASVILVSASQVVSGAYHVLFFFAV